MEDITIGLNPFGTETHRHSGEDSVLLPNKFLDRGDPSAYDFRTADFTIDNAWHDLDLTTIIGKNAKAVSIGGYFRGDANKYIHFRKKGNTNEFNIPGIRTQVDAIGIEGTVTVPVNQGVIQYKSNSLTTIDMVIVGWWE